MEGLAVGWVLVVAGSGADETTGATTGTRRSWSRRGGNLARADATGRPAGPVADLVLLVEDQARRTAVLEFGDLGVGAAEAQAPVETGAVLAVAHVPGVGAGERVFVFRILFFVRYPFDVAVLRHHIEEGGEEVGGEVGEEGRGDGRSVVAVDGRGGAGENGKCRLDQRIGA